MINEGAKISVAAAVCQLAVRFCGRVQESGALISPSRFSSTQGKY